MTTALGRISRISFATDVTRADAPTIALGFMFEAAWKDEARWLGLIGRLRLSPYECDLINLATWPELEKPFDLMDRVFEEGWAADWGAAAVAVHSKWSRSALLIKTDDAGGLLADASADSDVEWNATTSLLFNHLTLLGAKLTELTPTPVPIKSHIAIPRQTPLPTVVLPTARHPRRMKEDFALADAA